MTFLSQVIPSKTNLFKVIYLPVPLGLTEEKVRLIDGWPAVAVRARHCFQIQLELGLDCVDRHGLHGEHVQTSGRGWDGGVGDYKMKSMTSSDSLRPECARGNDLFFLDLTQGEEVERE